MENHILKTEKAAQFLREKLTSLPTILIMAGTGLGSLSDSMTADLIIQYRDIPGFPDTTVESHQGELVFGKLKGKNVAVMKGRFHLYEGYSPLQITFPIRIMQALGVKVLIITNASGGINLSFSEGDIMLIEDHINLTGRNPLTGPNNDNWGLRFPDMIQTYNKELLRSAKQVAGELDIPVCKGIYAGLTGPSLETPAEIRYLKTIGADSVGFSTTQEVIAGVHAGMKILGLSVITNINNPDDPEPATLEGVITTAGKTAPLLEKLIEKVVGKIND